MRPYQRMAQRVRVVTVLTLALLLLTLWANVLLAAGGKDVVASLIFVVCISLPLLILVPGLRSGRWKTFAWLGFVSTLYFAHAVVALFAPRPSLLYVLQLIFSIALFVGALLFIRWRARAAQVQ